MRKQKTGLQKDVGAIFQDAVISGEVDRGELPEDVGITDPTETDSSAISSQPVGIEEALPTMVDMLLEDPVFEEPCWEDEGSIVESNADETLADEGQTEISGFRRFLKLFTE